MPATEAPTNTQSESERDTGQDKSPTSAEGISVANTEDQPSVDMGVLGEHGLAEGLTSVATMAAPGPVGAAFTALHNFPDAMQALGISKGPFGVVGKGSIAPNVGTAAFDATVAAGRQASQKNSVHDMAEKATEDSTLGDMSPDVDATTDAESSSVAGAQMDAQAAENSGQTAGPGQDTGGRGEASQGGSEGVGGQSGDGGAGPGGSSGPSDGGDGGEGSSGSGHGADSGYGGPDGVGRGNDRGGGIGFLEGGLVTDNDPNTHRTEEKFAKISEGEFVLSRAAVQYYGQKKLEDMNNKAIAYYGTADPAGGNASKKFDAMLQKGVDTNKTSTTTKANKK
jgi:hypothetical protein